MKSNWSSVRKKRSKRKSGFSLIEMLMGMFIMSFVAAAIAEIATIQNVVFFKTYGKLDNILAARRSASDIEQAIHMARYIGDQFGQFPPPPLGTPAGPNFFPGGDPTLSFDPYEKTGPVDSSITGFAGFPSTTPTTTWPVPPYALNQQTLIVQVPVFSNSPPDACPTMLQYAPLAGSSYWNVDTYVYQVLADSTKPGLGQFILQKTIFPGEHNAQTQPLPPIQSNSPKTLMTGIIGPVNPAGVIDPVANTPPPLVFSYLQKSSMSATTPAAIQTVNGSDPANLVGVSINVELSNASASIRADYVPSPIAYHSEFYVRSNANSGY